MPLFSAGQMRDWDARVRGGMGCRAPLSRPDETPFVTTRVTEEAA